MLLMTRLLTGTPCVRWFANLGNTSSRRSDPDLGGLSVSQASRVAVTDLDTGTVLRQDTWRGAEHAPAASGTWASPRSPGC